MADGKGGRPSAYDPRYCETALSVLGEGHSVTGLAGHLGVARSTVYKWAEEHPEFSDALKVGQAKAAYFWERALRIVAVKGQGNASAAIFAVKNRVSDDWVEKVQNEHTGKDGGPLEVVPIYVPRRGVPEEHDGTE